MTEQVGNDAICPADQGPAPTLRLAAARLAARLEDLGVDLVVRGPDTLRATGPAEVLARHLTPELRDEIAALKPALLVVLDPLTLPLSLRGRSAALVLARETRIAASGTFGTSEAGLTLPDRPRATPGPFPARSNAAPAPTPTFAPTTAPATQTRDTLEGIL